jgi:hypothetical protein
VVRFFANIEGREKAGAWNTLAILAHESGYFFARLADLDGLKAMRGSSTMSYQHSGNPTLTRPGA